MILMWEGGKRKNVEEWCLWLEICTYCQLPTQTETDWVAGAWNSVSWMLKIDLLWLKMWSMRTTWELGSKAVFQALRLSYGIWISILTPKHDALVNLDRPVVISLSYTLESLKDFLKILMSRLSPRTNRILFIFVAHQIIPPSSLGWEPSV